MVASVEGRFRLIAPEGQPKFPLTLLANADFTYLLRKDGDLFIRPLASRISQNHRAPEHDARRVLHEEYDIFFEGLIDALHSGLQPRGDVKIHVFTSASLNKAVDRVIEQDVVVSLDPLYTGEGIIDFPASRIYPLGGSRRMREVPRPGSSQTFSEQAQGVLAAVGSEPVTLVDDNIITGGTILTAVKQLQEAGVNVGKIVTGVRIGHSVELDRLGIPVVPAVQYERTVGGDIFKHIELGEPRDFLLGASGLVTQFPNGDVGRVPFVLPFLSPHAKIGIPKQNEVSFSLAVLSLNQEFYAAAERKLGRPILLKDVDSDFARYMNGVHNLPFDLPMTQVIEWAQTDMLEKWHVVDAIGREQAAQTITS